MKNILSLLIFAIISTGVAAQKLPSKKTVLQTLKKTNEFYLSQHPFPEDSIRLDGKNQPSNIWIRSVYFEGLMALQEVTPEARLMSYAERWGAANAWGFYGGHHTRKAENLCCAQTYIDIYRKTGNENIMGNVNRALNYITIGTERSDWNTVSDLQMAMPAFAKAGNEEQELDYFKTLAECYIYARDHVAQIGLFNELEGLWWNNKNYLPPYKEPNGENCYWSRANGWAYAALARTLDEIKPDSSILTDNEKAELIKIKSLFKNDFIRMSMALLKCQREDGFWNPSLKDNHHYDGKETSGTALIVYGMAWGVRNGLLAPKLFTPAIIKGWNGLTNDAVRPDGSLGYIQGIGQEPKDGQPVTYEKTPENTDFAFGCFLLAGSEIVKLINTTSKRLF